MRAAFLVFGSVMKKWICDYSWCLSRWGKFYKHHLCIGLLLFLHLRCLKAPFLLHRLRNDTGGGCSFWLFILYVFIFFSSSVWNCSFQVAVMNFHTKKKIYRIICIYIFLELIHSPSAAILTLWKYTKSRKHSWLLHSREATQPQGKQNKLPPSVLNCVCLTQEDQRWC